MVTVEIPIKVLRKPPQLIVPDRCVDCAMPKAKTLPVKLHTGVQTKGGQLTHMAFDVPLCVNCAAKEDKIGNLTWIPF